MKSNTKIFLFLAVLGLLVSSEASGKAETSKYVPGEVLVKFKEGISPQKVLQSTNLTAKSVERAYPIKPAVEKFKKDHKLEKNSAGWYSFLGKNYKEINAIPDEQIFVEAYKNMPEPERDIYRTYKIKFHDGIRIEGVMARLKNDPDVEYVDLNYVAKVF